MAHWNTSLNDIQDGMAITLSVMNRLHKDFNPNDMNCYSNYNHELCDIFSKAMLELTGMSPVILSGEKGYMVCKYKNHYIDISGPTPRISILRPKSLNRGGN